VYYFIAENGVRMKRLIYYAFIMIVVVLIIPLFIVKSCTAGLDDKPVQEAPQSVVTLELKPEEIAVYNAESKTVHSMDLEEYVKCVVAAEMPAEFEIEALKAQAVAARTYAFTRMLNSYDGRDDLHQGADVCTDPGHCQAWVSKETAMSHWEEEKAEVYWGKIERAVEETRGIIITYEDTVANPVFHSNSGGRTENAENVWRGSPVPYLVSVDSEGEDMCDEYENVVSIKKEDFIEALKRKYPSFKFSGADIIDDMEITGYTEGGRVKDIRIGNITLSGTEFRNLYSLKSANFKIENGENGTLKITTIGNGHGVGMSQWGANYLAGNGTGFEEILKYYYRGIKLETIEEYRSRAG